MNFLKIKLVVLISALALKLWGRFCPQCEM